MKIWKKVLVGAVSVLTLGAGVGAAVASSNSGPSRRDGVAQVREGELRHEREPGDDRGQREAEDRGREAENEQEAEANDDRGHDAQHQDDRSGHDGRGADDRGVDA